MTDELQLPTPRIEWHPPRQRELRERVLRILHEGQARGVIVYWTDQIDGDEVIVVAPADLYATG